MVFHCKMPCVQTVHFGLGKIFQKSFPSFWLKENIGLAPKNNCLGLILTKELLPYWIQLHVLAIVVK